MRFKRYRFFNIGQDHYYYDDYLNESVLNRVAKKCYLPTNKILLELIEEYGCQFKVSFSITGLALDQFKLYEPDVLESFQKLAETGCVEFLSETYSHSLIAFKDEEEFAKQVELHAKLTKELFGLKPKTFRGTELIYSDEIGKKVYDMGYKTILTEGAKHILGWKSPNFLYCNASNPKQKVLLRNYELSDDLSFRFSDKNWGEYPLTPEKYTSWISKALEEGETVNLFMDYETFGEHQDKSTGIFDFLKGFPKYIFNNTNIKFALPSEIAEKLQPVSAIHVPHPVSWADTERDVSAWLGNNMQENAFNKLYDLTDKIKKCDDKKLLADWKYLQVSDHFYYMSTKVAADGAVHNYFNPFDSPYDAYINYMNILTDFSIRLNAAVPENEIEHEIATLAGIIYEKNIQLERFAEELKKLKDKKKSQSKKNKKNKAASPKTQHRGRAVSKVGKSKIDKAK